MYLCAPTRLCMQSCVHPCIYGLVCGRTYDHMQALCTWVHTCLCTPGHPSMCTHTRLMFTQPPVSPSTEMTQRPLHEPPTPPTCPRIHACHGSARCPCLCLGETPLPSSKTFPSGQGGGCYPRDWASGQGSAGGCLVGPRVSGGTGVGVGRDACGPTRRRHGDLGVWKMGLARNRCAQLRWRGRRVPVITSDCPQPPQPTRPQRLIEIELILCELHLWIM